MLHKVYLALGSNLGDRNQNLLQALSKLATRMAVTNCSGIYDTAPVGNTRQPRFLNMVCSGETRLTPPELLAFVKDIEIKMGRKTGPVNSPRPIDIDILFFDNLVMNTPELVIPHPRLTERVFVLLPLSDIAPDFKHPSTGNNILTMLRKLHWTDVEIVKWGG